MQSGDPCAAGVQWSPEVKGAHRPYIPHAGWARILGLAPPQDPRTVASNLNGKSQP